MTIRNIMDAGSFFHSITRHGADGSRVELWLQKIGEKVAVRWLDPNGDMLKITMFPTLRVSQEITWEVEKFLRT